MIVTVTLNAALDRTLTVPNFRQGHRHRASQGVTLAGGKGINVARALKRLDVPVVATGLAGGRTGTRIVEELTAEAILNDFVRIADESRTSTAVVDPTSSSFTEINEWGPHVEPEELEMLREKLRYLSRGAEAVVFAGSLPRGVDQSFYADAIRELNRIGVRTVLDTDGEPLRLGLEAEPSLVAPNQHEAEALVDQELEAEDFLMALDAIADLGARTVLITLDSGCYGLTREERPAQRFHATRSDGGARVGRRRRGRPDRRVPRLAARGTAVRRLAPLRGGRGLRLDARGRSRAVRAARGRPALRRRSRSPCWSRSRRKRPADTRIEEGCSGVAPPSNRKGA